MNKLGFGLYVGTVRVKYFLVSLQCRCLSVLKGNPGQQWLSNFQKGRYIGEKLIVEHDMNCSGKS